MKLINSFDRQEFKKTFLATDPFPHFCIDNFLNEEFAEESFHGVTLLTCPPRYSMRKSFATYYTKEIPTSWPGEHHSTIFRDRPDEWQKQHVFMPLEKLKRSSNKLVRNIKDVVKAKVRND